MKTTPANSSVDFDVVIVGAGFAGLYMLHRARSLGFRARVYEAGSGIGGTWFWNRYPGARCDIESLEYSYQFSDELQQEWQWTERYASQAEILTYLNHVADRFDLRPGIELNTAVSRAEFQEDANHWCITTADGRTVSAHFCVMATGCLSSTNLPAINGVDTFRGHWYHTGKWPHEGVDFTGKRVGVIGTGSSAIQSIPIIAEQARALTVFQRTPNYSVPANNGPIDPEVQRRVKADYAAFRAHASAQPFGADFNGKEVSALSETPEQRHQAFEERWQRGGLPFMATYADLVFDRDSNETAAEFIRDKIRGIVRDRQLAEALTPHHVVGCKRLCVDTGYYDTFNKPHVRLVDISESAIEEITPGGVRANGVEYPLDCIVFATGFDAMTGALLHIDPVGRNGRTLKHAWAEGARTYLGLTTVGFPNLFTITGPGSPSVLTNMLPSIEQHVNWIADCLQFLRAGEYRSIEPTRQAQDDWVTHVNAVADATLFPTCNSWYLGANVPGKPRVFMPYLGFPPYVQKCNEVAANGYEGFRLDQDARVAS